LPRAGRGRECDRVSAESGDSRLAASGATWASVRSRYPPTVEDAQADSAPLRALTRSARSARGPHGPARFARRSQGFHRSVRYSAGMSREDLIRFARRDWAAVARAKDRHWLREKRARSEATCVICSRNGAGGGNRTHTRRKANEILSLAALRFQAQFNEIAEAICAATWLALDSVGPAMDCCWA
jgi:hypothetical protein